MKVLFTRLMKMSTSSIGLLLLLYPLLLLLFFGVVALVLYFKKYELLFSPIALPMLLYVVVFFNWTWGIFFYIEDPKPTNTTLFKIAYWITLSAWLLNLASEFHLYGKAGFWLDNSTWNFIFLVFDFLQLVVFACYVYLCYSVAQKISSFQSTGKGFDFITCCSIFVFPIGIPILQQKIKKQIAAQPKKTESHFIVRY